MTTRSGIVVLETRIVAVFFGVGLGVPVTLRLCLCVDDGDINYNCVACWGGGGGAACPMREDFLILWFVLCGVEEGLE